MTATMTVDVESDVAYLKLSENEIVETCEVAPGVLVDLDEMRVVVGVEVLALDLTIPRQELIADFHMLSQDVAAFDSIRPNVMTFVQRQSAPTVTGIAAGTLTKV